VRDGLVCLLDGHGGSPRPGMRTGQSRDRTGDLRIFSPSLYQLSYLSSPPNLCACLAAVNLGDDSSDGHVARPAAQAILPSLVDLDFCTTKLMQGRSAGFVSVGLAPAERRLVRYISVHDPAALTRRVSEGFTDSLAYASGWA